MKKALEALRHGREGFIFQSLFLAAASFAANALNYFYHIYVGRTLGPEDYGVFASLFAIAYFIGVSSTAIQTSVARFVSEFQSRQEGEKVRHFFSGMAWRLGILSLALFALLTLLAPAIGAYLRVPAELSVIAGATAAVAFLSYVATGTLQGLRRFALLGAVQFSTYGSKFLLAVLLLRLGLGVSGALWAMVLGYVFGLTLAMLPLRSYLNWHQQKTEVAFGRVLLYARPALLASLCFAVPTTVDVVMAKHYLSSVDAGFYAAASVLGKVLLYAPLGVSLVLFPHVQAADRQARRPQDFLRKAAVLTILISGSGVILYWIATGSLLTLFFGGEFGPAAPLVRVYGLAMFLFSLTTVFLYYNLALDNFPFTYVLTAGTGVEVLVWLWRHDTPLQIAEVLLVASAAFCLMGLLFLLRHPRRPKLPAG